MSRVVCVTSLRLYVHSQHFRSSDTKLKTTYTALNSNSYLLIIVCTFGIAPSSPPPSLLTFDILTR